MSDHNLEHRFGSYHKPTDTTAPKFEEIQVKSLELALLINKLCPECDEKSESLIDLQKVKMLANASIALYTEPTDFY